ncbi:MAG TPA: Uma2 family endonuclease [Ktedonobacteraceae bacterium]|nr:Uma2 family endonuclease [Ktedonobacteraceae bacterium]
MAVQTHVRVSVEEFEQIAALPENKDRRLEYIGGEIVEVVSNSDASEVAFLIGSELGAFNKHKKLGRFTTTDGGYMVAGERYMPDIGFISNARQPERPHAAWNPLAPDLAVEVVSPTDSLKNLTDKVVNYLAAGTLTWVVYPDTQEIHVYEPGKPVKTLTINDTLDGGKLLPGFKVALKDIFPTND